MCSHFQLISISFNLVAFIKANKDYIKNNKIYLKKPMFENIILVNLFIKNKYNLVHKVPLSFSNKFTTIQNSTRSLCGVRNKRLQKKGSYCNLAPPIGPSFPQIAWKLP
jgi:uncharacterized protein (UPF0305 family)